jgi:hypothetical protein
MLLIFGVRSVYRFPSPCLICQRCRDSRVWQIDRATRTDAADEEVGDPQHVAGIEVE